MQINVTVASIVAAYLLLLLLVGWYASKRITSNADFMVAGRRLSPLLMAGTLAATQIGGSTSLGVVENGMDGYGLSAAWYIITMGFAFVILTTIAPKFQESNVKTVPEYFRRRYGKSAGYITAVIMLLPLVGLTAGQYIVSAVVLSTMLGIPYIAATIIVAVVVIIYAILGGMWSVTLTDCIQVCLIVGGMLLAVPFALQTAGGWENVVSNVPPETFHLFTGYNPLDVVSLTVMYVATFTVGQEAASRYYAARDGKAARQGSVLAALVNFVFAFIPAGLGVIMLSLLNMGRFDTTRFALVGDSYALPVLAIETMPSVICGLLFAGIVSATMSNADSHLLAAGSIFTNDIYRVAVRPDDGDAHTMKITRMVMVLLGVVAMFIAMFNTVNVLTILLFCFTLRAAGSFIPYILGHYWKGASLAGTIASLIGGSAVVIWQEQLDGLLFGMRFGQPIIPGIVVGLVLFVVFSKLFPPKELTTELAQEE